jgi:hypothetical protein
VIVSDQRLGQMLEQWAAILTPAEKAEANAELVRWCEVHEAKANAKKRSSR